MGCSTAMPLCNVLLLQFKFSAHHLNVLLTQKSEISAPFKEITTGFVVHDVITFFTLGPSNLVAPHVR